MSNFTQKLRTELDKDFTVAGLKMLIVGVCLFFILLALLIDNPWVLAGIAAYIILP
jgi:hypothetical protein